MDREATAGLEHEEVTALVATPVHARLSPVAVDAHAMNHKEIT
jgi:hypothetical protein